MKVYSIGREMGCDIVINDSTDVISRRHAILNVTSSGKMTIVDQSHNGTYVNGIRIAQNVPVPVTRKDNISFAHVARLDWNAVPKQAGPWPWIIAGVVVIALIVGGIFAYRHFMTPTEPATITTNDSVQTSAGDKQEQPKDSTQKATPAQTATPTQTGAKQGGTKQNGTQQSGKSKGGKDKGGKDKSGSNTQNPGSNTKNTNTTTSTTSGEGGGRGMR